MFVAALVVTLGAAASGPSLAAPAKITICYQLKNGPNASWKLPAAVAKAAGVVPQLTKGTTWTAFATRVGCQTQAAARSLLAKYPAAHKTVTGAIKPPLARFTVCVAGNGKVSCLGKNQSQFTLIESGSYTLAQIKQLTATGKLPFK